MSKNSRNIFSLSQHKIYHYQKLMRFLRNRYAYEFKDDEQRKKYDHLIPFRYLEKLVAAHGRAAIYKHDTLGFAVYKPVMAGNLNIYGNPGTYFLYTANGSQLHKVQADDENLLILQDNFDGSSFSVMADYYAHQLGKTRETIITNVHAMRTPFLVRAPKEQLMAVRLALEAVNEAPEVIQDDMFEVKDTIQVIDLKTPDHLKSLEDEYNTIFAKFKEEIGFSSQNIDKKERLVAAEAEDDNDALKAFDNEPFENRKKFVKSLADKWGIEVNLIKANDDLYAEKESVKSKPDANTDE